VRKPNGCIIPHGSFILIYAALMDQIPNSLDGTDHA